MGIKEKLQHIKDRLLPPVDDLIERELHSKNPYIDAYIQFARTNVIDKLPIYGATYTVHDIELNITHLLKALNSEQNELYKLTDIDNGKEIHVENAGRVQRDIAQDIGSHYISGDPLF